jgi:hypothetical protein
MSPETVAAFAAVAAAAISLLNIAVTRHFTKVLESTKWTRELLPDLVRELDKAFHVQYMALFNAPWDELTSTEAEDVGIPEFDKAHDAEERLEVFASPEAVTAAREVRHWLEAMRFHFLRETGDVRDSGKWPYYWRYAEASHAFVNAARKEMGLKPVPLPPGLADRRRKEKGSAKRSLLNNPLSQSPRRAH